ncbi:MAG: GIDE domain-containing protein, partial [Ketobacteraceae bacterium]|nr:GIDE domain-containing protein [Ketobacteraceae bacterium]
MEKLKNTLLAILQGIAAIVFGFFAFKLTGIGLQDLRELRQLERIPRSDVAGVIEGETIVSGTLLAQPPLLRAPKTSTPSIYYRYRVEKRCKDSDGNESWCTQSDREKWMSFSLFDSSGELFVRPSSRVDWHAPQRFQTREGNYRYTEWRLEPGDSVNIIGWIDNGVMTFFEEGLYLPIISDLPLAEARGDVGHIGLLFLWGGVSLGLVSLYCIMLVFRIHRLLIHVTALTAAMLMFLATDGLTMIRQDLLTAHQWLENRSAKTEQIVQGVFETHDMPWMGWQQLENAGAANAALGDKDWLRVRSVYENLLTSQQHVQEQSQRFFGWLALAGRDVATPGVPVFDWVRERIEQQQVALKSQIVGWASWLEMLVSGLLTLVLGWWAVKSVRWKRMMENLPTAKIKGIMPGLTEIKGLVELQPGMSPLVSPMKSLPCVYYHYVVKEKRGSGKKSRWVTITDEQRSLDFFCEDETGKLLVDLDEAEVICKRRFSRRQGRRRYRESIIGTGDAVYAIGTCDLVGEQGDRLHLTCGDKRDPFIVSSFSEAVVMLKRARLGMGLLTASFSAYMLLMLIAFGKSGGFAFSDIVIAGLTAPVFGVLLILVLHYNDMIFLRQRVL